METLASSSTVVSGSASTVADIFGSETDIFEWSLASEFFLELTSLCCKSLDTAKFPFELF